MSNAQAFVAGMAIVGICCLFLLAIGAVDLLFTALIAMGERRRTRGHNHYLHGSH